MRIVRETGILTRRVSRVPLDEVRDPSPGATLRGRWLSYGDVEVLSAEEDGPVAFQRTRDPEAFRNVVLARRAAPPGVPTDRAAPRPAAEEQHSNAERLFGTGVLTEAECRTKRREPIREL